MNAVSPARPAVSVIVPAHNPDRGRLQRTLDGLRAQNLPAVEWETILVDNASRPAVVPPSPAPANLRLVVEPRLGLSAARRRGIAEARGSLCVFVDDDNVLFPDYLEQALRLAAQHARVGAFGGRSRPEFETPPPPWAPEFFPLLALRDPGSRPIFSESTGTRPPGIRYPAAAAPIGAGLVIRSDLARTWAAGADGQADRRGGELSSGGDNEIVFAVLLAGWEVAYFPELTLTHLIPAARLDPEYLARLNRGIQKSWMEVLTRHDANPWPAVAGWTVPLRQAKAWLACRGWTGDAARIRWQGACGHFEGRRGGGRNP